MSQRLKVATGLAKGMKATPQLAAQAVMQASNKAGITHPASVLLYLTTEFASNPLPAIKAAASAASTTHVMGCSASGIFTEEEWVLDGAAAAAMVFSENVFSTQLNTSPNDAYLLTLAAPSALNATWLDSKQPRFGGVSGDATGHGPFSVWQNGKGLSVGHCEFSMPKNQLALGVSHGLKLLSSPRKVTASQELELSTVANVAALSSLMSACHNQASCDDGLPFHLLMVAYASHAEAFANGNYQLASIIMSSDETNSITLSHPIKQGSWVCWAIRDAESALIEMQALSLSLQETHKNAPDFGLLFSCLGRGPYFYNGDDLDLLAIKTRFPEMPMIGFYGNGEIAPMLGNNTLLPYSAVLGLFYT
jgi:small ligand-binding sensory domain FIST